MLHSICQQIWKTQQWPQDWKRSIFIPVPKKGNAKECSNYRTIALISHASKVILKILWVNLQQYGNQELPKVQAGFRKGRGTRDIIASSPLALVMFPKAHLTSQSRMSASRWVITPSWLSGSLRSLLYSSSVYSCHCFLIFSALRWHQSRFSVKKWMNSKE